MRIVLSFLTRLPVGVIMSNGYFRELGRRAPLFPLAGLLVGCLSAATAWLAGRCFSQEVAAAAAIVTSVTATGGLHLDGLMDTADGIMSCRPREQMLAIMRDSRIGAMAAIALGLTLLLRYALLATTPPPRLWQAIVTAPALGRAAMVVAAGMAPQACAGAERRGLGAGFAEHLTGSRVAATVAVAVGAAALVGGWRGVAASCATGVSTWLAARGLVRLLGGLTGDTLGAINELAETTALAVFACTAAGLW